MSEPSYPPPPPSSPPPSAPPPAAPQAKKKGLHPLAWVGIGCGALLVLVLVVLAAFTWWAGNKVRDVAKDFEDNPAMAAAVMAVRLNPEVELVDSDKDAGTLTVRNKETGEEMTFDLEEIEDGKLEVLTGDGERSSVTFGGGEGGVEITAEKDGEKSRMRFGAGDAEEIPDWVPIYPGSEPSGTFLTTTSEGASGAFGVSTSDPPDEVLSWYGEQVEELGIDPRRSEFSTPVSRGGTVTGSTEGREIGVTVTSQDEGTMVTITFSDRQE